MEVLKESIAYRRGWEDGRFGRPVIHPSGSAGDRPEDPSEVDRIAYHYGHREGNRIRSLLCEDVATPSLVLAHN